MKYSDRVHPSKLSLSGAELKVEEGWTEIRHRLELCTLGLLLRHAQMLTWIFYGLAMLLILFGVWALWSWWVFIDQPFDGRLRAEDQLFLVAVPLFAGALFYKLSGKATRAITVKIIRERRRVMLFEHRTQLADLEFKRYFPRTIGNGP